MVHDVCAEADVDWQCVPFHRRGRMRATAERTGFELVEHLDLTARITPTLARFTDGLAASKAERVFALEGLSPRGAWTFPARGRPAVTRRR